MRTEIRLPARRNEDTLNGLMISRQDLSRLAEKLGVFLSDEQSEQIAKFASLLATFNEHTNLIANSDASVLLVDHILDSLSLIPVFERNKTEGQRDKAERLIDIGTGAGLPGLVIAIAKPDWQITLIEAVGKKIRFLNQAVEALGLAERVFVRQERAELLAHDKIYRHQFDYVTARAVGGLDLVLELTLPFLRAGGFAILQKSAKQCLEEAKLGATIASKLEAKLVDTIALDAAVLGKDRGVLVFCQTKAAPMPYPRPWQKMSKTPLS